MAREVDAFMNCVEVRHVRPGWVLSSVADLFKSEWVVESTWSDVPSRDVVLTMRCGGRVVTKATSPTETVLRKVFKKSLAEPLYTSPES